MKRKLKKWELALLIVGVILITFIIVATTIELAYLGPYLSNRTKIATADHGDDIVLMSCNVRCWTPTDFFKQSWFYRADLVRQNIQAVSPDIIGFQEVTKMHYDYLTEIMPDYDSVIEYRQKGILAEGCPVFYRKDLFTLINKGSFWLSETPNIMSKGWGAQDYRICSYVVLRQNNTGKELIVFNTHLDHVSEEARINGINLVLSKIEEFSGRPTVLIGDMNDYEDSSTIAFANANFDDAKVIAPDTMDGATFQKYGQKLNQRRIDYAFVSKTGFNVQKYAIVQNTYDGVYPSDHFPIYIRFNLV